MTKRTFNSGAITLVNADSLEYLKTIPDNSIDLVATDPPYFQVKQNAWDNQWDNSAEFLAWLDEMLCEFWRILKPNGSIYLFCGHALSADTEILIRSRFNVLNNIVWTKPSGPWNKARKSDLRKYFGSTERIIFAEHYGSEGYAKGNAGYATKCAAARKEVFKPLIDYFRDAKNKLDIKAKDINQATGTQMCSHWFSDSQWALPSADNYAKLQALFKAKGEELQVSHAELADQYGELQKEYQELTASYDELKAQYQSLRRPFSVSKEVPFTDHWHFKSVQYYPGKHPCEKPAPLMEHIISSSSREGDVVLDAFGGSQSTGKACLKLGRKYIGIELEEETFDRSVAAFEELVKT